jgi:hypothetical protein
MIRRELLRILVDDLQARDDHLQIRVLLKMGDTLREALRMKDVVGIQNREEFAIARQMDPSVQSDVCPSVFLFYQEDARIFELPDCSHGVVGRSVIDNYNAIRRQLLGKHGAQGIADVSFVIVKRDDDTNGHAMGVWAFHSWIGIPK